jgi:phosphonate transport system substrate-binding protein
MPDLTGQQLAERYQVREFLGRGGMAEVYRVFDSQRHVELALKLLHADLSQDIIFLRRFKREAQTLSTLQHPNIVRFFGFEKDDLNAFILMDYIPGTTLRSEIARQESRPFPLERILAILNPVCSALNYAHHMGFIHCDVKPANIMLHQNGSVLLADFGIARMSEAATTTMMGAGTPAYMALEQVKGLEPCPQTDIYALGIVLYEMLTGGERPFTGEQAAITGSVAEKLRWEQLYLAPVSPKNYNPGLSRELEGVVLRCLEKEPASRFGSALEMLDAFQAGIRSADQTARPYSAREPEPVVQSPVPGTLPFQPFVAPADSPRLTSSKPYLTNRGLRKIKPLYVILAVIALSAILLGFAVFKGDSTLAAHSTATSSQNQAMVPNTPVTPVVTQNFTPTLNILLTATVDQAFAKTQAAQVTATFVQSSMLTSIARPTDTTTPTVVSQKACEKPAIVPNIAAGALGSPDKPIVIAFVPSGDTGKITVAGNAIAACLSKMTGLAFKIEVGTSYNASIEAMGAERAQVGFLNAFSVLQAKAKYQIVPALATVRKYVSIDIDPDKALYGQMEPFYRGEFIANVASNIKTFADLKGKTFCFVDPNSTSGYIVPQIMLKANGIDPARDFKAVQNAGSHPDVATTVYKGDCDAGSTFIDVLTDAASNLKAKYPDILTKVKPFALTDRIPNDGVQYIKSLDPKIADAITTDLLIMAKDPGVNATLVSLYNIPGFQKIDATFYDDFAATLKKANVDPATLVK